MNGEANALTQINPRREPVKSHVLILTLAVLAALSGVIIVFTVQLTKETIRENKARALKAAVLEVVPDAEEIVTFVATGNELVVLKNDNDEKAEKYFAAYDDSGRLKGVAFEGVGQGYADKITVIFGYSPDTEAIIGMKVLESKETPGLGDKIDFDPAFKANFENLDVRLDQSGSKLKNPIQVVKPNKKSERWQIAAITGATISSKAIGKIVNRNSERRLAKIHANLSRLRRKD